jgi:cytochrome c7-like protein
MAQIFHRSTNTLSRLTIYLTLIVLGALLMVTDRIQRSGYITSANVVVEQPIPFSHKHHVADDGIDCRYCHTSVETSAFAGIPPTRTCMNCHSLLFADSPFLKPVRDSYSSGVPIEWNRVHKLADYVYFDHSIHIAKGIGCATCHGQVDQMPLVRQVATLQMEWCIDCHRQPEKYLRPKDQVFNMAYQAPSNQIALGLQLKQDYHIRSAEELTSCSTCHR